jgi:hypothetical protein
VRVVGGGGVGKIVGKRSKGRIKEEKGKRREGRAVL